MREVPGIDGYQYEPIGMSDRRNLAIHVRGRPPKVVQTRSLAAVPGCGKFVVRQNRKRCVDDILEISLEPHPALTARKTAATISQFMPNRRSDGAFQSLTTEPFDDLRVWIPGDGGRHDTSIQKVSQRH